MSNKVNLHNSLRTDRLITQFIHKISLYRKKNRIQIPILMYHSVSDINENREHPYYSTATNPAIFRQHMNFLKTSCYSVITMKKAVEGLFGKGTLPQKPVVVTFDDGFRDFYTEAFPIMISNGFPATVFLATNFINNKRLLFKEKECLTWSEIIEMDKAGIELGSHTVTHPELILMNDNEIEYELRKSKETIQERLGKEISYFSYPYAFPEENGIFKDVLKRKLYKHGYKGGVTTIIGRASITDNKYFLKRIPVNTYDDPSFFKAKLVGAYDWIHICQLVFKKMKCY